MGSNRSLMAGLVELFGGFGPLRVPVPSNVGDMPRPSVDDVWKRFGRKTRVKMSPHEQLQREKKKRKWKMEKHSRKVNYARNGTRG